MVVGAAASGSRSRSSSRRSSSQRQDSSCRGSDGSATCLQRLELSCGVPLGKLLQLLRQLAVQVSRDDGRCTQRGIAWRRSRGGGGGAPASVGHRRRYLAHILSAKGKASGRRGDAAREPTDSTRRGATSGEVRCRPVIGGMARAAALGA